MLIFLIDSLSSELLFSKKVFYSIDLNRAKSYLREAAFPDLIDHFILLLEIDLYYVSRDHSPNLIFEGGVVEEEIGAFTIIGEEQHQFPTFNPCPLGVHIIQGAVTDKVGILFTLISENSTS
jgi:hypothetical protein